MGDQLLPPADTGSDGIFCEFEVKFLKRHRQKLEGPATVLQAVCKPYGVSPARTGAQPSRCQGICQKNLVYFGGCENKDLCCWSVQGLLPRLPSGPSAPPQSQTTPGRSKAPRPSWYPSAPRSSLCGGELALLGPTCNTRHVREQGGGGEAEARGCVAS